MTRKILINALDSGECRIVTIKDNKLEELHLETSSREMTQGNIYKGIIVRVEPSLQAVFVDYGAEKNGFLQKQEIHSDYFMDSDSGDRSLTTIVKKGQELIVQVTKDPIMHKGAMLTTFISLPGRLSVLMPGSTTRGVSRQIESEDERKRLKDVVEKMKLPEGFGLIVRTAGKDANKTMLTNDLKYLLRAWKNINEKSIESPAPSLLYKEQNLAVRSLRDYFTAEVSEILIDDAEVFREVKDFIKIIAPKQQKIVRLFKGERPIFTKYQLEDQIASIFDTHVPLKSGGAIVIDQTEALVAIDVNSGKSTGMKNIEQTAYHTNLEAAEEVARQLRLRDMGGLIVVDFIDMKDARHKAEIAKVLKNHLKSDKAKTKVGAISRFGLLEMSRQRLRPSITFGSFSTCIHCKGRGMVPSIENTALAFMRQLNLKTIKGDIKSITATLPADVAEFLLNKKRKEMVEIETRRNISISIIGSPGMIRGEMKFSCEKEHTA
ncbi:Rne2 [Desulfamplus magnetovallimortis]|uniref:Ribonuclease G n=1 Tax=Desulfamplus magnetovallimortis TaxID=1246637 RepID=A0A1W1H688_9BACT|nr:Rne/Rng family ribonuclease [Desulfamplus magnetovallimortis]SLM27905.1 Rne2 [Desulfamplus magnetovallimortis]